MDTSIVVPLNANSSLAAQRENCRAGAVDLSQHAAQVEARLAAEREAEHLRERVRQLATELAAAQEAARGNLARELHDGVGAELTAARFALANVETWLPASAQCWAALALAQRSLDAASDATRRVVEDLHVTQLEAGIVHALSQWTDGFAFRTQLRTSFVCAADVRLTQLPHDAALAVFRVAQEALNNVARHAHATRADVRIETGRRYLTLFVEDDGTGLARRARNAGRGFGVAGMRARCEAFGGKLRVASGEAQGAGGAAGGTTVRARFAWVSMLDAQPACRRASRS
jgi:two-component system sensor histidine kinase UhpB